jgi:hypothetical protein
MNTHNHLEAVAELRALIDRARRQDSDLLDPLPLISNRSARIVATMDGMLGLVRHDDEGNAAAVGVGVGADCAGAAPVRHP